MRGARYRWSLIIIGYPSPPLTSGASIATRSCIGLRTRKGTARESREWRVKHCVCTKALRVQLNCCAVEALCVEGCGGDYVRSAAAACLTAALLKSLLGPRGSRVGRPDCVAMSMKASSIASCSWSRFFWKVKADASSCGNGAPPPNTASPPPACTELASAEREPAAP